MHGDGLKCFVALLCMHAFILLETQTKPQKLGECIHLPSVHLTYFYETYVQTFKYRCHYKGLSFPSSPTNAFHSFVLQFMHSNYNAKISIAVIKFYKYYIQKETAAPQS